MAMSPALWTSRSTRTMRQAALRKTSRHSATAAPGPVVDCHIHGRRTGRPQARSPLPGSRSTTSRSSPTPGPCAHLPVADGPAPSPPHYGRWGRGFRCNPCGRPTGPRFLHTGLASLFRNAVSPAPWDRREGSVYGAMQERGVVWCGSLRTDMPTHELGFPLLPTCGRVPSGARWTRDERPPCRWYRSLGSRPPIPSVWRHCSCTACPGLRTGSAGLDGTDRRVAETGSSFQAVEHGQAKPEGLCQAIAGHHPAA